MYLTVGFLTEINNIITDSYNITLRKVIVKPDGFDKVYMDKEVIEDKVYQIIDQFNEKELHPQNFINTLEQNISTF